MAAGGGLAWYHGRFIPDAPFVQPAVTSLSGTQTYAKVHASVARISTKNNAGSGAYIGNRIVLTAAHVVMDANAVPYDTTGIEVRLRDGKLIMPGKLLAWSRVADLAIVQLPADPGVPAMQMAPAGSQLIGRTAYMVGMPAGFEGAPQLAEGTVSVLALLTTGTQVFEHTMRAPPGMSGAPIIDDTGRIVGIQQGEFVDNTARLGLPTGVGVVPAEVVARLKSSIWVAQNADAVAAVLKDIDATKP
ncbi:MAG: trypsin-like peptidase domain-containing protein [Chloroflexi bacterium]|nr:trypsin-like peptidase domain-containing protein [Chloroflexota bacterium]